MMHDDGRPMRIAVTGGDERHSQVDGSGLVELPPGARPVAFRDGLEDTLAWFRSLPVYAGV